MTIGVEPVDASNAVAVRYRINQGSTVALTASHLPLVGGGRAQYFRATLPAFQVGDRVEYTPICRCAGRQVPSPEETKQFAGSFRVVASQQMPNTTPTDQPGGQQPSNPSLGSTTEPHDGAGASTNAKTQPTASNSKEAPAETAAASSYHETHINTLNAILTTKEDQQAVKTEFLAAKGDWTATLSKLKDKLPEASLQKVALTHSLADWSGDNVPVVKAVLAAQPDLMNLRDVALRYNVDKLTALVNPKAVPETTPGATADEKQRNFAVGLRQKLFVAEPTAVLHRMVEDAEVPIADVSVRSGITQFLSSRPDFNILE